MKSKIILGTVQFGMNYGISNKIGKPSSKEVGEILNFAYDNGISTVDSADGYGDALEILGNYNHNNTRKYNLNTKFKACELELNTQLDISLQKMNADSINVYYYHSFEDYICYPAYKEQLSLLKDRGKIKRIGLSVYENIQFKKACEDESIDVIQVPYNLLDNQSQKGALINLAKNNGKQIQVRSVFLQGLFFLPISKIPAKLKSLIPYLKKVHEISKVANISIGQLALNYTLQQEGVDHVIIGVESLDQLKSNIFHSKQRIPVDIIQAIDRINVQHPEMLYPKNWP